MKKSLLALMLIFTIVANAEDKSPLPNSLPLPASGDVNITGWSNWPPNP